MKFSKLSKYLQELEETSKRLEITAILADLIDELDKDQTETAVYLALGYLQPAFESIKFNVAEKMMIRSLAQAFDKDVEEIAVLYKDAGDLGEVAQKLSSKKESTLTVGQVHKELSKIAEYEGSGSQDRKITGCAEVIKQVDELSARYVTRIILGTMRLGFTELTVIDALNKIIEGDKKTKKEIETTYNTHPDIGLIAKKIKSEGLAGIKNIGIEVGVPILSQKAQRIASIKDIIEKIGTIWAEYKFDGVRVQLHMDRNKKIDVDELEQQNLFEQEKAERMFIKTFTRNLEETSYQYPDLIEAAKKQIKAENVILDGEAIGFDKDTGEFLPFQQIMQRKRKHNVKEMAKQIPMKYFVFDLLYVDGKDTTQMPLTERKATLKKIIKPGDVLIVDDYLETSGVAELQEYFDKAREKGLEGLIVKNPKDSYQAGARSFSWVKYKVADEKLLDDTVDCVVLGYYFGRGARSKLGIGGFLVGIYDNKENKYKTLTKVGTGLTDVEWEKLKSMADKVKVAKKPDDYDVEKTYEVSQWIEPKIVVELGADEISESKTHTAGYALRFPRLIRFRPDKKPEDTTTLKEIKDLHKMQKRGYHTS